MHELSKVQICGHEFKGRPCRFGQIIAVSKAEAKELVSSGKADWAPVIPTDGEVVRLPKQGKLSRGEKILAFPTKRTYAK